MIILSCVIFDQKLKITFRKSSATPTPSKKSTPPFNSLIPLKNKKAQVFLFLPALKIFKVSLAGRGGGHWTIVVKINNKKMILNIVFL